MRLRPAGMEEGRWEQALLALYTHNAHVSDHEHQLMSICCHGVKSNTNAGCWQEFESWESMFANGTGRCEQ